MAVVNCNCTSGSARAKAKLTKSMLKGWPPSDPRRRTSAALHSTHECRAALTSHDSRQRGRCARDRGDVLRPGLGRIDLACSVAGRDRKLPSPSPRCRYCHRYHVLNLLLIRLLLLDSAHRATRSRIVRGVGICSQILNLISARFTTSMKKTAASDRLEPLRTGVSRAWVVVGSRVLTVKTTSTARALSRAGGMKL